MSVDITTGCVVTLRTMNNTTSAVDEEHNQSTIMRRGAKIEGTLLTIIGPAYRNRYGTDTWRKVLCRCECGREVIVPYYRVYAHNKYSCGCRRKTGENQIPLATPERYAGFAVAHWGSRRLLTIIGLTPGYDCVSDIAGRIYSWDYTADCCGETFQLHYSSTDPVKLLKKLLRASIRPCPNPKCPTRYDPSPIYTL